MFGGHAEAAWAHKTYLPPTKTTHKKTRSDFSATGLILTKKYYETFARIAKIDYVSN